MTREEKELHIIKEITTNPFPDYGMIEIVFNGKHIDVIRTEKRRIEIK